MLALIIGIFYSGCANWSKSEDINGVKVINITRHKGVYSSPSWSPDGEKIAFQFEGNIYVTNYNESSWKKLTKVKTDQLGQPVVWNGQEKINYVNGDPSKKFGANENIHSVNLYDEKDIVLIQDLPTVSGMSWNPCKPELVIGVYGDKENFVYLYDFLENRKDKIIANGRFPKWSRNGKLIAYLNEQGISIYDVSSRIIRQIYKKRENEIIYNLSWSPDGKWIAYRGGPSKELNGIYVLPSSGSNPPEQILNAGIAQLDWSPQGDKIVFTTINTPSTSKIYIMDVPKKFQ